MNEIYSSSGTIRISSDNNYYYFYNDNTKMSLMLYKKDIKSFMSIELEKKFVTDRSSSNYMVNSEKKAIKSYLRIKNKRLRKIQSLLDNGEKLKDIINIMPLKTLIEYIGENKWKNL